MDDKNKKRVFLRVSEESEAYGLYDPTTKKIMVKWDVNFDEDNKWNWESTKGSATTKCELGGYSSPEVSMQE